MATKALKTKPKPELMAFGENFGIAVPTKYSEETHALFNTIMAIDSAVTPMIFGMSGRTVWLCRLLAGALFVLRDNSTDLRLRYRLQIEVAAGVALIWLALRGSVTPWLFERLYLIIGGGMIVANALMTQVEP